MTGPAIEDVRGSAYRIPTERPESDGTLEWDSVTVVIAEVAAGGQTGIDVTAGEYGYQPGYFRRMLEAGAVDVLQADATRCCGITGLLDVRALCTAAELPFSAHCAPQIHAHAGAAIGRLIRCEYFHTHARAEAILFDGVLEPQGGRLVPDAERPGLGIELKRDDVERFRL